MAPEDNPADEQQPTKEAWEAYESFEAAKRSIRCRYCDNGQFITECCNGAGGCDCRGQQIDMGPCNVCGGTGYHEPDADTDANLRLIRGQCFIGRGPTTGMWATMGTRGGFRLG